MKTRLSMHLKRHPEEEPGYICVKDSASFQAFGEQQMSTPGVRAKLQSRHFINMLPEEILSRKESVGNVGTLKGIKRKYQYICLPDGKVSFKFEKNKLRFDLYFFIKLNIIWNLITMGN